MSLNIQTNVSSAIIQRPSSTTADTLTKLSSSKSLNHPETDVVFSDTSLNAQITNYTQSQAGDTYSVQQLLSKVQASIPKLGLDVSSAQTSIPIVGRDVASAQPIVPSDPNLQTLASSPITQVAQSSTQRQNLSIFLNVAASPPQFSLFA